MLRQESLKRTAWLSTTGRRWPQVSVGHCLDEFRPSIFSPAHFTGVERAAPEPESKDGAAAMLMPIIRASPFDHPGCVHRAGSEDQSIRDNPTTTVMLSIDLHCILC